MKSGGDERRREGKEEDMRSEGKRREERRREGEEMSREGRGNE